MLHTDCRLLPFPDQTGAGPNEPRDVAALHLLCAAEAVPPGAPGGTGRIDMEVIGQAGEKLASLELVLRPETVEVWHRYRCCVITGRDGLRRWFRGCAALPLVTDEVTWSRGGDGPRGGVVCVEVEGLLPRVALPEQVVRHLHESL